MRTIGSTGRTSRPGGESLPLRLLILTGVTFAALVVSVGTGASGITVDQVLAALAGGGDPATRAIVRDLRLPRATLAVITGGGLAVAGAVFQALLRNPLAEPYVLGVSNGAALGAVALIATGVGRSVPGLLPLSALLGAVLAITLVFRIALRVGRALDTRVLLLAGVVVGAFLNSIILLLLTYADVESFRSAIFWMMGSLANADWRSTAVVSLYVIPAVIALIAMARPFNLLAMGEETALHLGTRVERVKIGAFLVASLLVAATVAVCGVIGFIGLIVPHALRLLWGSDHRWLLPGSFLAGGSFLLLADTTARTIAAPAELPVGVITALVGVPIFVLLLTRTSG